MLKAKSAKRYAKAFYELALEENQLKVLIDDFSLVSNTINSSSELTAILSVPMISNSKLYEIINSIFKGKINDKSLQYLEFLIHKNRIAILDDVVADLIDLFNDNNNIKEIKITSAFQLSNDELDKIKKKVGAKLNKTIIAKTQVSAELIGGFKIQVEDKVYDFSVLSQLNELENNFINVG